MWHRRWRRSTEAKTEEIFVVGCFTSSMCKWIGVMIAVDQACPGDDVGLHQGFGRVDRPCPGDDEVLKLVHDGERLGWPWRRRDMAARRRHVFWCGARFHEPTSTQIR